MKTCPLTRNILFGRRGCITILALSALSMTTAPALADDADVTMSIRTAVARQAAEWNKEGKPVKYDFDFGDFKAWARRDGSWNAEGRVQHRGLLCGTYTLSLRVGHGNPGCNNVQWFGDPRPVASVSLCNNAVGNLSGGDTEFSEASRFDEITCAQRTMSCSGNCK